MQCYVPVPCLALVGSQLIVKGIGKWIKGKDGEKIGKEREKSQHVV